MKCIYCNANTKVIDSRESQKGTRRRRECLSCRKRFTTLEAVDPYTDFSAKKRELLSLRCGLRLMANRLIKAGIE